MIKLLGVLIVILGFALKLDSILIIVAAMVVTALVGGMVRWHARDIRFEFRR